MSQQVADSTVRVATETRKRLASRGSKNESYDEIIRRLLAETEGDE